MRDTHQIHRFPIEHSWVAIYSCSCLRNSLHCWIAVPIILHCWCFGILSGLFKYSLSFFIYFISMFFQRILYFYHRPLQSSREVVTFQIEYPPPPGSNIPVRPFGQGCSNLYCSQSLLQFLKATHVKLHFHNHTLVQNPQHKYYGLERILVTGRLAYWNMFTTF